MISISEDELRRLLEDSFEQGWGGYFDLKDECVDKILKDFLSRRSIENNSLTVSMTSTNIGTSYYSYNVLDSSSSFGSQFG
jgi:hypothetical protein